MQFVRDGEWFEGWTDLDMGQPVFRLAILDHDRRVVKTVDISEVDVHRCRGPQELYDLLVPYCQRLIKMTRISEDERLGFGFVGSEER